VRFRPGGSFPFFRIPARKFADTILPIDELLPKKYRVLEQQLYALETSAARVQLLNRFFLDQVPEVPVQWETTCRFIAASASGRFTIAATLRELPYHYRTLERHFKTATGLSPEEYLKIRRFNNAVQIMYSGRFSRMTEIAYQAGYYDQSHFIRDFKKFSGQTPLQFIRSQFKIVEVIQPALAERLSKSYNFGI
jgi:AraC-like DNA-binding protein